MASMITWYNNQDLKHGVIFEALPEEGDEVPPDHLHDLAISLTDGILCDQRGEMKSLRHTCRTRAA